MQHAGGTLRKIVADALRREGSDAPVLAWPLACGARTAQRTRALSFSGGLLTVAVPDRTWQHELQRLQAQLLSELNKLSAERVSRIEFVPADRSSQ